MEITSLKYLEISPLPSGKLTWLWKMAIYSEFSHWKWWFSIAMLVYQRVHLGIFGPWRWTAFHSVHLQGVDFDLRAIETRAPNKDNCLSLLLFVLTRFFSHVIATYLCFVILTMFFDFIHYVNYNAVFCSKLSCVPFLMCRYYIIIITAS